MHLLLLFTSLAATSPQDRIERSIHGMIKTHLSEGGGCAVRSRAQDGRPIVHSFAFSALRMMRDERAQTLNTPTRADSSPQTADLLDRLKHSLSNNLLPRPLRARESFQLFAPIAPTLQSLVDELDSQTHMQLTDDLAQDPPNHLIQLTRNNNCGLSMRLTDFLPTGHQSRAEGSSSGEHTMTISWRVADFLNAEELRGLWPAEQCRGAEAPAPAQVPTGPQHPASAPRMTPPPSFTYELWRHPAGGGPPQPLQNGGGLLSGHEAPPDTFYGDRLEIRVTPNQDGHIALLATNPHCEQTIYMEEQVRKDEPLVFLAKDGGPFPITYDRGSPDAGLETLDLFFSPWPLPKDLAPPQGAASCHQVAARLNHNNARSVSNSTQGSAGASRSIRDGEYVWQRLTLWSEPPRDNRR